MFNIKIYDREDIFKTTLSEKQISSDFSFSATVGSGVSNLKFEYYGDYEINHRDRIKIYREGKLIYQGFVIGIQRLADRLGKKIIVTLSGLLGLLAYKPWPDGTYSHNPGTLIKNIFEGVGGFDTEKIQTYPSNISLQSTGNSSLQFLQEILKTISDFGLFLTVNNEVIFGPYEKEHILTYGKEVYGVEITEDSSDYYNKFRINYSGGNLIEERLSEIENYGESYQVITDSSIKNLETAQARIHSLFQEKAIKKTIKVKVNKSFNYYSLLPGEIVSIRNTNRIIENKPIKSVTYGKDTATLILESYTTLEHFISYSK